MDDVQRLMKEMAAKLYLEADNSRRLAKIVTEDRTIVVAIVPRGGQRDPGPRGDVRIDKTIHRKLLAVITGRPQTIRALARLAMYSPRNDHVRRALYELRSAGAISKTKAGYFIPGKEAPCHTS